jgi:molecular chaperone DnaK
LISFSDEVTLQADATDNARRVQAAINRLEPDGTTNLADALALARVQLSKTDRRRYIVILTDGYPDAAEAAVAEATAARDQGIDIVAIGIGAADREYLRRLASTESGSIFATQGELVSTFGHIARMIAEGGRGLRTVS